MVGNTHKRTISQSYQETDCVIRQSISEFTTDIEGRTYFTSSLPRQ